MPGRLYQSHQNAPATVSFLKCIESFHGFSVKKLPAEIAHILILQCGKCAASGWDKPGTISCKDRALWDTYYRQELQ